MLLRVTVFVMMALGLLGFGMVAISMRSPQTVGAAAPAPKISVLVAAHAIHAGALLKPDDLTVQQMTASEAPAGATLDTPAERGGLIGAMVRRSLAQSQPVVGADVVRPGDHGFLAAVLAPGMRAVTVGVDAVSGSAGLIWPGDHVDLILTQSIEAPSLPLGRRVAAETVLGNARVIAIDQHLVQGTGPGVTEQNATNRTVTLEVNGDQAERVAVAARLGRLSLSVRSADAPLIAEAVKSGPANVTWASDVSPALSQQHGPEAPSVVRVFQGTADGKEFRF